VYGVINMAIKSIENDRSSVKTMVFAINLNLKKTYPRIKTGMFRIRYIVPMGMLVMWFMTVDTPVRPPGAMLFGAVNIVMDTEKIIIPAMYAR